MLQRRLILFFILISISLFSFSQSLNPDYLEFNFHTGYAIKNHPQFPDIDQPSLMSEIRIGKRLNGVKPWHKHYNYADVGFSFIFGSLGNNKVIGNSAALIPEMTFHQKLNERWNLSESLGLGISYFNRPYNEITNPGNIAMGSHFSFGVLAAANFDYQFNEKLLFTIRPCLYHSSNSHSALPNVGLNLPMVGIGVKYRPHGESKIIKSDSLFSFNRKIHFAIRVGIGVNEQGGSTGPVNGPKYPIYITSVFLTKKLSPVNKVQMGMEGWYNTGVYDYITSQDFFTENQKLNSTVLVFFLGHEFLMGHFSLVAQGGIYIYNPFYREKLKRENETSLKAKLKTIFPARIGYHYYLFDSTTKHRHNFFAAVYIKSNLGQADFLDTGIGYMF